MGNSVFLTNDVVWKRQRRIIDPAFEGGRLRDTFPGILAAADAGVIRIEALTDGKPQEIEAITSHIAADVIFRTLFSIQIEDETAQEVFHALPRISEHAADPELGGVCAGAQVDATVLSV